MGAGQGNEAFKTVQNTDSGLRWWKNAGLLKLNLLISAVLVAQFLNGYDAVLVSGFQAMPSWNETLREPSKSSIGLINAATYLAGIVTAPIAAYVSDRWGRKWCIRYAALTNLIGTAVGCAAGAGSSHGYAMFIISRIIIGSGFAFAVMVSPIMLQELPHPRHRTWLAGFFDVAFIAGNFVASWVVFGCSYIASNWSWRIPYIIHIPFALVMIVAISFVPESPRWLMMKGREQEAEEFFTKYHSNGVRDELVAFEVSEVKEALIKERERKDDSWGVILRSPSSRHKLAVVVLISTAQNLAGTAIIAYYYTSILSLVGITGAVVQTGINAGLTSFTVVMALFGLWLTQRINRRPQMLGAWVAVLCANIGLTVCTAMYTKTGNKGAGIGAVVFVWLYNGAFFVTCGSIFFSMPAEVLHLSMRAKGMMIWTIWGKCLSVFSSYTNPVAMANIGWKWYTFYTAMIVLTGVLMFFLIVETRGYTLEEIAQQFDGKRLETAAHPEIAVVNYEKGQGVAGIPINASKTEDEENSLESK